VAAGLIFGLIVLADSLRPVLPWLLALFFLACILRIAIRDS
jgi:hypothetical protein